MRQLTTVLATLVAIGAPALAQKTVCARSLGDTVTCRADQSAGIQLTPPDYTIGRPDIGAAMRRGYEEAQAKRLRRT